MKHPARGPVGTTGIDSKPIGASRRQHLRLNDQGRKETGGGVS
jgi:hypothetical protein